MTTTVAQIVQLVRCLGDISASDEATALVQRIIIDAAAAAAAAQSSEAVRAAMAVAQAQWGLGSARVWFQSGAGLSITGATFVNAVALSALDIDDGNRLARGHLSAAVLPAAVAVGAGVKASPRQLSHAMVAGSEIAARLGSAEIPPFFASGRWAGVGAAVAAGLLLNLDDNKLGHAIALALHAAPVMAPAGQRKAMTGHIKEGVPFGALSGTAAVFLAQQGFRGDPDALESAGFYDAAALKLRDPSPFAFRRTYFKIYACCRLAHAAIDAATALQTKHRVHVADIQALQVYTFRAAIELPNESRPTSFESAQYSLPLCIATALVHGKEALLPLSPDLLRDRDVQALAQRVHLHWEPAFDDLYPGATPTRVTLESVCGDVFTESRETAQGDPSAPFPLSTMLDKFKRLAATAIAPSHRERIAAALRTGIPSAADVERLLGMPQGWMP